MTVTGFNRLWARLLIALHPIVSSLASRLTRRLTPPTGSGSAVCPNLVG
jgi:hypothetical protein